MSGGSWWSRFFFFSSRRRHTRSLCDWSSDVCSSDLEVADHYTHGDLERAILAGLRALGRDADDIRPEDLAAIDEFHIGGQSATDELAAQLDLKPGTTLLDLGSGLGGPARLFARQYGCSVIGLDLTPEYVLVAARLTELVGLQDRAEFRVGSALELPFAGSSFDRATLLHIGMNIPDKERLCREVYRVLKPGGLLGSMMSCAPGRRR